VPHPKTPRKKKAARDSDNLDPETDLEEAVPIIAEAALRKVVPAAAINRAGILILNVLETAKAGQNEAIVGVLQKTEDQVIPTIHPESSGKTAPTAESQKGAGMKGVLKAIETKPEEEEESNDPIANKIISEEETTPAVETTVAIQVEEMIAPKGALTDQETEPIRELKEATRPIAGELQLNPSQKKQCLNPQNPTQPARYLEGSLALARTNDLNFGLRIAPL
jgi:hypothetical protein